MFFLNNVRTVFIYVPRALCSQADIIYHYYNKMKTNGYPDIDHDTSLSDLILIFTLQKIPL